MTRRWPNILLWVWVGGTTLAVAALSLYDIEEANYFLVPASLAMILGALIITRVPGNRIGLVMLLGGSAWLIYVVGRRYALASIESGPFPGEYVAAWLGAWLGPLFLLSFPTLLALFPDGRARGWRRWLLGALSVIAAIAIAGGVNLWGADLPVLINDIIADASARYAVTDTAFILSLWAALPATISVIGRYRGGDRLERQQIKWLLVGASVFAVTLLLAPIFDESEIWGATLAVVMAAFPVAVGIAVFRYRLYDLGRLVSRTVSYAMVVAILGVLYALGAVFVPNQLMGMEDPSPILVAASTLAAAALFNPIRRWARSWVDRRFNRSRYDAVQVMDLFTDSLHERVDTHDVIDGWVNVVEETMQPMTVGVWLRR